jgi:protein-tyrosine phosphatase
LTAPPPTEESFWAEPGRLLAGKYPGSWHDPVVARVRVEELLGAGVTLFLDLTEERELDPYAHLLDGRARHLRRAIVDMSVCSEDELAEALDAIDGELERGGLVYVHCWGGCGRTGTVVSAWWVRHGVEPWEALRRYQRLSRRHCPETPEQHALVLGWASGR